MNLQLSRPLAFFDLETTGTNTAKDRIVEIAIIKLNPDGSKESYSKKVNPEMPIPIVVSEIHGIYDVDIVDCPTFKDIAKEVKTFITDADLAGFNSNRFDIPLLVEEMLRSGIDPEFDKKKFVDIQNVFHKMEQRTLVAAYKFYCNKDLTNAHSAEADTLATLEVLEAQIGKYDNIKGDVDFLSDFTTMGARTLDFSKRIAINEEDIPVFNFGKHKGIPVVDIFKKEPGYFNWLLKGDFTLDTKNKFRKIKEEMQS